MDPLSMAFTIGSIVVSSLATLAFKLPELYEEWFNPIQYIALTVSLIGSVYFMGLEDGIALAFRAMPESIELISQRQAITAGRPAYVLWFMGGLLVFEVVHILFSYIAHRMIVKNNETDERHTTKRARDKALSKRPPL